MEQHLLAPGVKDHGEPAGLCAEPFGRSQLVAKRGGCGGEEQVEGLLCILSEKQPTQFFGHGEPSGGGSRETDSRQAAPQG